MSSDETEVDPLVAALSQLAREIGDKWHQDDDLLEKFFPIDPLAASSFREARKALYNDKRNSKRWKSIPSNPKSISPLHTPLRMLMNNILYHYGISEDTRLYLDTHRKSRRVFSDPPSPFSPSLFLAGAGKEFVNTTADLPREAASSGITPIQIALDAHDLKDVRNRLAMDVQVVFRNQDNRRFAYGLVITQTVFMVYMFDRSGAVASLPCNYHQNPDQFCAVISGLASDDIERNGFDHTMFAENGRPKILSYESSPENADELTEINYFIEELLFQSPSLVGRGTLCWLTTGPDDAAYVVKDAWIATSELPGRESEGTLLRHAQSKGVTTGISQIRHFEEVRCGADARELDTVVHNRRLQDASIEDCKVERIHTRIVMATHGKTMDNFATPKELMLAFHDAVVAHRKLHDDAGILHRDISIRNILINPDGVEGDRGILIDFDHAIRVGDTSPYSTKKKIGTWRYMSRNVLKEGEPHTYIDDLESFYWSLCWILAAFKAAGVLKAELPLELSEWDLPSPFPYKNGHIGLSFELPISPWFGKALPALAKSLHAFFRFRRAPTNDPTKDYDEFILRIRKGLAELEQEELDSASKTVISPPGSGANDSKESKRKHVSTDDRDDRDSSRELLRRAPPSVWLRTIPPKSMARPRRSKANYRVPPR